MLLLHLMEIGHDESTLTILDTLRKITIQETDLLHCYPAQSAMVEAPDTALNLPHTNLRTLGILNTGLLGHRRMQTETVTGAGIGLLRLLMNTHHSNTEVLRL